MELAGVVLGATPVIVGALQLCCAARSIRNRIRNRQEHIAELVRALDNCHVSLENYLMWALKGAGIEPGKSEEVPRTLWLLSDKAVRMNIEKFLGDKNAKSFCDVMSSCKDILTDIHGSLIGVLPPADEQTERYGFMSLGLDKHAINTSGSLKFVLRKDSIERLIRKLDSETEHLHKLQSHQTAMLVLESRASSANSPKTRQRLDQIRQRTQHLHHVISHSWKQSCHPEHCAHLFLEDRLASTQDDKFRVVFAGKGSSSDSRCFRHECIVHVEEDDVSRGQANQNDTNPASSLGTDQASNVTEAPASDGIVGLCQSISDAERSQVQLELSLSLSATFSARPGPLTPWMKRHGHPGTSTSTLSGLLLERSSETLRSRRLPLKACLLLAHILAASTVQIGATQWLQRPWSKDDISFLGALELQTTVNLTQPMLYRDFSNSTTEPDCETQSTEARQILLEFGIVLIELWQGVVFESYCNGMPHAVRGDYHSRRSAAATWLEECEDDLPPVYFEIVNRCIRVAFNDVGSRPKWDDEKLIDGLVKEVVEPLRQMCRINF